MVEKTCVINGIEVIIPDYEQHKSLYTTQIILMPSSVIIAPATLQACHTGRVKAYLEIIERKHPSAIWYFLPLIETIQGIGYLSNGVRYGEAPSSYISMPWIKAGQIIQFAEAYIPE